MIMKEQSMQRNIYLSFILLREYVFNSGGIFNFTSLENVTLSFLNKMYLTNSGNQHL